MKDLLILPRLSEKTYGLSASRVYVIDVPLSANKHQVKAAVESQFEVSVVSVNISRQTGKSKRTISKKGRRVANGTDKEIKKAYVTLAEGNELPFFQAIEEEQASNEKLQAELAKQLDKEDASDEKPKKTRRRAAKKEEQ